MKQGKITAKIDAKNSGILDREITSKAGLKNQLGNFFGDTIASMWRSPDTVHLGATSQPPELLRSCFRSGPCGPYGSSLSYFRTGKKKAYTALLQCRTSLCRTKWGPQRKDIGGRYGFPGFQRVFVSTTDLESVSLRPEKFPKRFSFGGGRVRFFLLCRRVLETPAPTGLEESTAVHLQFVRQYCLYLYRWTFLASKP